MSNLNWNYVYTAFILLMILAEIVQRRRKNVTFIENVSSNKVIKMNFESRTATDYKWRKRQSVIKNDFHKSILDIWKKLPLKGSVFFYSHMELITESKYTIYLYLFFISISLEIYKFISHWNYSSFSISSNMHVPETTISDFDTIKSFCALGFLYHPQHDHIGWLYQYYVI